MKNTDTSHLPPPAMPTLGEAFGYWLKLGFISFGGPAGQISMMHHELVEKRRWISEQRFLHALNYCMLLPGPEAIQLAIYISWLLHGVLGAVIAGGLFFLPAFVLLSGLAAVYLSYGDVPFVQGIFAGIKPAVVAVVVFAAWRIGSKAITSWLLAAIAILAFIGIFFFRIDFPWIVVSAAILGVVGGKVLPDSFRKQNGHPANMKQHLPALIDDTTPPPLHARFSWLRAGITSGVFVSLWGIAMLALTPFPALLTMGAFFTKAAFLSIGGAYAVLPYVNQAAVIDYGWLTGAQMIDGLALGESTPGPLIMIVTWVGYIGGVSKEVLALPFHAGLGGATVATFFTFLPSFFFVLVGAPLIETTRNIVSFSAPLSAITAAVVGVIVNLAFFFAWQTFWPQAPEALLMPGYTAWPEVLIAVLAMHALWRYRVSVIQVIGASACIGLVFSFWR